jgi:hypothetical protein
MDKAAGRLEASEFPGTIGLLYAYILLSWLPSDGNAPGGKYARSVFLLSSSLSSVFWPGIPLLFSAFHHCTRPQQAEHAGNLPVELLSGMDVYRMDCRSGLGRKGRRSVRHSAVSFLFPAKVPLLHIASRIIFGKSAPLSLTI